MEEFVSDLLSKREIVARARLAGIDLGTTISCYRPIDYTSCGACDACALRARVDYEAGE